MELDLDELQQLPAQEAVSINCTVSCYPSVRCPATCAPTGD
ncbi:ALQxL family class IV lanthipeptide [Streptomyces griseorubiginosus]